MKGIWLVALATLSSACNLAYVAPTSGDVAYVRFHAPEATRTAQYSVGVYLFPDDRCSGGRKLRTLGGMNLGGMDWRKTDLGMLKDAGVQYERSDFVEVPVTAERRLNFTLAGSARGMLCYLTLSFLPRVGRQYEVVHSVVGDQCKATVSELTQQGKGIAREKEPTAAKNARNCTFFWN